MKIAIIQSAPAFLDKAATLQKCLGFIEQANKENCQIIAFGETWFSGYPTWLDFWPNVAIWDNPEIKGIYQKTVENAVAIDDKEIDIIKEATKKYNLGVVIGINEKVNQGPGNGSLFNTILTINEHGHLANHHRKLVPTFTEKMVYAHGDGAGLQTVEIHGARIGSLICWEHWLPMARQAMHNNGEAIHFALWPWVHDKHQLACRQYAMEGRCHVIGVGQIMRANAVQPYLEMPKTLSPESLLLKGGSCVVAPDSTYLLEPNFKDEFITVTLDLTKSIQEQMTLDVTGNYARWDVFDFVVNKMRKG